MQPTWKNFIDSVVTARLFIMPAGVTMEQLYASVDMRGPGIDWIDPKKESEADVNNINNGLKSRHQVIREHNGDPRQVDRELAADTFKKKEPEPQTEPVSSDDEEQNTTDEDDSEAA